MNYKKHKINEELNNWVERAKKCKWLPIAVNLSIGHCACNAVKRSEYGYTNVVDVTHGIDFSIGEHKSYLFYLSYEKGTKDNLMDIATANNDCVYNVPFSQLRALLKLLLIPEKIKRILVSQLGELEATNPDVALFHNAIGYIDEAIKYQDKER